MDSNIKCSFNLCSIGDPLDPKTWSGTPFNLYSEFNKLGTVSSTFPSNTLTSFQRVSLKILSRLRYGNTIDLHRGEIYRRVYANNVKRLTDASKSNKTLHFGTTDLPFSKYPVNQKHFLYCDTTWNLWSKYVTNLSGYSKKLLADSEKLEKESYQQITHFFPISEYVKENLISHYNIPEKKITVVGTGTGIIQPFFGNKDYKNKKILFTAKGRFEDKGGELVIEAFKIALRNDPQLQLSIVGQKEYTEKFNLPNITTYGFIPKEDLQNLFNTHSVFIMPAINEPWGLVYVEALMCKMPIIGLNRNSLPEITDNGKYGILLDDPTPEILAGQFLELFSHPQQLEEMGSGGQGYISNRFTWEITAKKIVETIKNIS